jgi:hypothetical protein
MDWSTAEAMAWGSLLYEGNYEIAVHEYVETSNLPLKFNSVKYWNM